MNATFRCERCGETLCASGPGKERVRCPHCGKAVTVPEGLASLPHPLTAGGAPAGADPQAEIQAEPGLAVVERVAPYVLSLMFHLGLVLVSVFVGTVLVKNQAAVGEIVTPAFALAPQGGDQQMALPTRPPLGDPAGKPDWQKVVPDNARKSLMSSPGGDGREVAKGPADRTIGLPMRLFTSPDGKDGGTGLGRDLGPPRSDFFPPAGRLDGDPRGPQRVGHVAHHVVYVVDRSGSMIHAFDAIRAEMLRSIGMLEPNRQDFHVILFSDGSAIEAEARRLVPATAEFQARAAAWLQDQTARGLTDPVPALTRAFDVLDRADAGGGKVIYLLTDSQFPDHEAVLKLLRQRNAKKEVIVHTFLYGDRTREAVETMEKVARENGGSARVVRPDE